MASKLNTIEKVRRQLEAMIPDEYKTEINDLYIENGILSVRSDIEFIYEEQTEEIDGNIVKTMAAVGCSPELSNDEVRASSWYAYRYYLLNLRDTLNRESMGIKTMTLEIKEMHKRVEAINDLLVEVNREINKIECMKCIGRVEQFGKY